MEKKNFINEGGYGEQSVATPVRPFSFIEPETKKDPEDRVYLVLYIGFEDNREIKAFEEIVGRQATYDFVKGIIDNINIYESKVLAETVPYKDALNVYEFMKQMKKYIVDTSFEIEDYNYADDPNGSDNDNLENLHNTNNYA